MNTLNIDVKKGKVNGELQAKVFENDGYWIFYVPALDLSSYAKTPHEAEKFFFEVYLDEFFLNFMEDPKSGYAELEKLGWTRNKLLKKRFISESYVDRDGFLNKFDLPQSTPVIDKSIPVAV